MSDFSVKRIVERANTTPDRLDGAILKASINFAPMGRLVAPITRKGKDHRTSVSTSRHAGLSFTGIQRSLALRVHVEESPRTNLAMQNVLELQILFAWVQF
jgi:hypothetical protein